MRVQELPDLIHNIFKRAQIAICPAIIHQIYLLIKKLKRAQFDFDILNTAVAVIQSILVIDSIVNVFAGRWDAVCKTQVKQANARVQLFLNEHVLRDGHIIRSSVQLRKINHLGAARVMGAGDVDLIQIAVVPDAVHPVAPVQITVFINIMGLP